MKALNLSFVLVALLTLAADWPDFLPQTRLLPLAGDPPLTWSPEQNILWQSELPGDGQSSPVVWEGKVVVSSVAGEMKDHNLVIGLDLASGTELWRYTADSSLKIKSSLYISRAAPTPAADAAGVVVLFESGDVIALDWEGKLRWQRALTADYGEIKAEFGLGASLAQHQDTVFALIENEGPSYLVALDKATGQTRWKVDRPSVVSWSSPAVMTLAGTPQVVISSVGTVDSYDVASGDKLWTVDGVGGNTVATPSQVDGNRLIIGASAGRGEPEAGPVDQSNLLIRVSGEGQTLQAEVPWRAEKAQASFSSPLAYQGVGYWVNRAGVVFAIDLADGKELFAQRLDQAPWATAIGVGERVYFFGKDGTTTVLRAGKSFDKLASNVLWDPAAVAGPPAANEGEQTREQRAAAAGFAGPIQYGAALADDSFVIRTGNRLYRVAGN